MTLELCIFYLGHFILALPMVDSLAYSGAAPVEQREVLYGELALILTVPFWCVSFLEAWLFMETAVAQP